MNERIQELIEQATKVVEPNDADYRHEIFDKEKFAELIIRECMDICCDSDDYLSEKLIRNHFGIEK